MSSIIIKDHRKDNNLIKKRIIVSGFIMSIMICVLVVRVYDLQINQYKYHVNMSEQNRIHTKIIPPNRGLIFDRNGIVLADNRPSFNLTITKELANNIDKLIEDLSTLLELTQNDVKNVKKRLIEVKRRPYEPVTVLLELTKKQVNIFSANQYYLPGSDIEVQFIRHYPFAELFSHAVGHVGRINNEEKVLLDAEKYRGTHYIGKTGIEKFYEKFLHGDIGREKVETNARGRILRIIDRIVATNGNDIYLTLDTQLQKTAYEALGKRKGAIVAIEPKTGDILAFVSNPSFDPNPFVSGISQDAYNSLLNNPDKPLYNRASLGQYPPGSTIKPIVALAGLDTNTFSKDKKIYDAGYFQISGSNHQYRNWNRAGDGWVDFNMAMARSNDTYFYTLAYQMGIDKIYSYFSYFGFGKRVSLDILDEAKGIAPNRQWKLDQRKTEWYIGDTVQVGIGQGFTLATPLQLAQAMSTLALKGTWITPHMALKVGNNFIRDEKPKHMPVNNQKYFDDVHKAMGLVMHSDYGTARRVGVTSKYKIAGKSGTAQVVAIKQGATYNRNSLTESQRDHALFVGFAPLEDPQIAASVIVENGESGSSVAAPILKMVMDAWLLRDDSEQFLAVNNNEHRQ